MSVTPASAESTPFEIAQAETPADTHAAQPAGEVHTETGVAHGEEHASGVFPPFDQTTFASQVLWLAITFGLFYLLMSKLVIPRIGGILETRHDRIAQDLDEASRLKAEADAAIASYEQELASARAKGNAIASTARDEAKAKAVQQTVNDYAKSVHFYSLLGLKQIVDSPENQYARFETAGGATLYGSCLERLARAERKPG